MSSQVLGVTRTDAGARRELLARERGIQGRPERWIPGSTHTLAGFERAFAQVGPVPGAVFNEAKETSDGRNCTPRRFEVRYLIVASSSGERCGRIEEQTLLDAASSTVVQRR